MGRQAQPQGGSLSDFQPCGKICGFIELTILIQNCWKGYKQIYVHYSTSHFSDCSSSDLASKIDASVGSLNMRILEMEMSKSSSKQKRNISWQCCTCARVLPHQARTSRDQLQTARLGRPCCTRRDAPSSEGFLIKGNREVGTILSNQSQ